MWLIIKPTLQILIEHLLCSRLPAPGAPSTSKVFQGSLMENQPVEA